MKKFFIYFLGFAIIFFIAPMMLLICDKTKYKQKWENSMF